MISSPRFLKARAIAFSLIMVTSMAWIVCLCVYAYVGWDTLDTAEQPIIALMLLIDVLTIIMLLILLILPFREWLDAARFLFLLLAHIGIASTFAYWNPRFHCPTTTTDSEGVCRLLNLYILVASWVIPVLLILYASGLAFAMVRSSRPTIPPMMERESILPMMRPVLDGNSRTVSYSSPTDKTLDRGSAEEQRKHISGLYSTSEAQRKHRSELSSRTNSLPSSLTKPPPAFFV
ncbi:hypothetical protein MVEN_02064600 [Mycena venus]|uniref:Transmembrane protein n=1 Tax=Mycena venus TaxID=2733690 RepID=A0A8H6XDC0_9AGAR|nr:hypothetical protein MVEN_02064600 [Mycena venus]